MLSLGTTDITPVCARTLINIGMDRLHISRDIPEDEYSLAAEACGEVIELGWILLNYDGSTINQIHTNALLALRYSYHSKDFVLFLLLLQSGANPNASYRYSEDRSHHEIQYYYRDFNSGSSVTISYPRSFACSLIWHALHHKNTPYTFVVALIQHNVHLSPNVLYAAMFHHNDYLVGVLAPQMICSLILDNVIEVPTLQQWVAHWLEGILHISR